MKSKDYELVLDALDTTAIYVISEERHEILYYNQRVKNVAPNVEKGMVCHKLWAGKCDNCPLNGIGDKKKNSVTNYNDPFGKAVDIVANRILWKDTIPAFVISITPHQESASYSYHKIFKGNLTLDRYEVVKVPVEERNTSLYKTVRISEWFGLLENGGYIHTEDVERFREFVQLSHLREELRAGKNMLSCNYRRRSGKEYRWNTLEVLPDAEYSDKNQSVMIYVKDVQDMYKEGLGYEELNLKNEAILKTLGEENFGIYLIDLNEDRVSSVRVAAEDEELVGGRRKNWDKVMEALLENRYHPNYWNRFRSFFAREVLLKSAREGKKKLELVAERRIGGAYHYISATAYFYNYGREKSYAVMAFQDVDARIRSEIERAQNDRRMAAIIQSRYGVMNTLHLSSGICERVYLHGSDRVGKIERGEYARYIERAVEEYVRDEDRERFLLAFSLENLRRKAEEVKEFEEIIFEYQQKKAPYPWLEEHIFFIRQETGVSVNILGRDITLKKQREEKVTREAREKAYIINSLSSMFFATYYVDLQNCTFQAVVQRDDVKQMLGEQWNYTEGMEQYADRFIHPDDREEYKEKLGYSRLLKELSPEHPSVAFEYRKAEKLNGKTQWTRASVVIAECENGRPKTAIYVAQDITESKEKEERDRNALKEACDAANHANAAKSEFLSRMSHDIRTPMNAIIGMTAIAGTHLEDREKVSDCLGKITIASRHLLSLINEVLDMSKIESGKIDLMEEEFSLSDLLESILTMIHPSMKAKEQHLEARLFKVEHENVVGDAIRLQQVFMNILSNAVKYTQVGGKVEIEITEKPSKIYGYGCYEFVFQDNGIGMSEEYQKKIFEPFTRAEDCRVSKIEGTGLGMTIAQNIVRMMSGSISVESKENEGSRFTVTLFLKQQSLESLDVRELQQLRVLVADDDECSCEAACKILTDIGMYGEWVLSGEEAVGRTKKACDEGKEFFAVILDWKMPGMDGIETARAIRKLLGEEVPIIILSAYDWSDVEDEAREAGVNGFILKPLFKSRLVYMFKQFVGTAEGRKDEKEKVYADRDYSKKRILLVEDNELNREIAQEIIGETGVSIECAVNGQEAVWMYEDHEEEYYDLIFMDIQMPVMDGYTAARMIRCSNKGDAARIPIIAMTANAFSEDITQSRRSGMNEHITKPLDIGELMRCMDKWL
ncbi:response regulator [Roseburia hominis]